MMLEAVEDVIEREIQKGINASIDEYILAKREEPSSQCMEDEVLVLASFVSRKS